VPPIPGLPQDWVDHVTALDLEELPESMLVLGGGPVGLEFAQTFARFGTRVTVVQGPPRIAPRSDADATEELTAALEEEGIEVITGTTWAAGDVTGIAQFTPIAQYQSRIAVEDMFAPNGHAADYSILPTAIFTDPELAGVGLTEHEARERGLDVEISTHPVAHVTRSQYVAEKHGVYKLVYERESRRVLGLHVVSRNASDIVQGFALALRFGATVEDLAGAHHIYPSWGEGVKAAAEKARPARARAAVS
jgi:pyruvate/2-oxoglutarate dehydrogenase complex dihydrolipoamide dehydrogenase (E3) component